MLGWVLFNSANRWKDVYEPTNQVGDGRQHVAPKFITMTTFNTTIFTTYAKDIFIVLCNSYVVLNNISMFRR